MHFWGLAWLGNKKGEFELSFFNSSSAKITCLDNGTMCNRPISCILLVCAIPPASKLISVHCAARNSVVLTNIKSRSLVLVSFKNGHRWSKKAPKLSIYMGLLDYLEFCWTIEWRRGWDSNPRYVCTHNGFRDCLNKKLRANLNQ